MFREGLGKVLECLEKVGESSREGLGKLREGLGQV